MKASGTFFYPERFVLTDRVFADENRFYVLGEFDEDLENGLVWALTKKIEELKSKKDASIDVYINSYGGDAYLCLHLVELFEIAKRNDITVRTIVPAVALSAGSMLAVAGTKGERYIAKNAEHLVHYGQFDGSRKTTPLQIDRTSERWKRWTKTLIRHYQTYAEIPDLEEHLKDDDFWIESGKCIKWKLADKYMSDLH